MQYYSTANNPPKKKKLNVKSLSKFKIQWQQIVQERKRQIYFIISYSMPATTKKKKEVICFKFHNHDYVHKWIQQKRNKPSLRNFNIFLNRWTCIPIPLQTSNQFGISISYLVTPFSWFQFLIFRFSDFTDSRFWIRDCLY